MLLVLQIKNQNSIRIEKLGISNVQRRLISLLENNLVSFPNLRLAFQVRVLRILLGHATSSV